MAGWLSLSSYVPPTPSEPPPPLPPPDSPPPPPPPESSSSSSSSSSAAAERRGRKRARSSKPERGRSERAEKHAKRSSGRKHERADRRRGKKPRKEERRSSEALADPLRHSIAAERLRLAAAERGASPADPRASLAASPWVSSSSREPAGAGARPEALPFTVDTRADLSNLTFGRLYRPHVPPHARPARVSRLAALAERRARAEAEAAAEAEGGAAAAMARARRYFVPRRRGAGGAGRVHTAEHAARVAEAGAMSGAQPRGAGGGGGLGEDGYLPITARGLLDAAAANTSRPGAGAGEELAAPPPASGWARWEGWAARTGASLGRAARVEAAAGGGGRAAAGWLRLLRFDAAASAARGVRRGARAAAVRRLAIADAAAASLEVARGGADSGGCAGLRCALVALRCELAWRVRGADAALAAWDAELLAATGALRAALAPRPRPPAGAAAGGGDGASAARNACALWAACAEARLASLPTFATDGQRAVLHYGLRALGVCAPAARLRGPRAARALGESMLRLLLLCAGFELGCGFAERALGALQAAVERNAPPEAEEAAGCGPRQPRPPPPGGPPARALAGRGTEEARAAEEAVAEAAEARCQSRLHAFWEAEAARPGDDAPGGAQGGGWAAWEASAAPAAAPARTPRVPLPSALARRAPAAAEAPGAGERGTAVGPGPCVAARVRRWAGYEAELGAALWQPLRFLDDPRPQPQQTQAHPQPQLAGAAVDAADDAEEAEEAAEAEAAAAEGAEDAERVPQWADAQPCAVPLGPSAALRAEAVLALASAALGAASAGALCAWPHTARPRLRASHPRAADAARWALCPAALACGGGVGCAQDAAVALAALRAHAAGGGAARERVCAAARFGQRACARWLAAHPADGAVAAAALHCAALAGGARALRAEGRRLLGARPDAPALWAAYATAQRAHAEAAEGEGEADEGGALGWGRTLERAAALLAPAARAAGGGVAALRLGAARGAVEAEAEAEDEEEEEEEALSSCVHRFELAAECALCPLTLHARQRRQRQQAAEAEAAEAAEGDTGAAPRLAGVAGGACAWRAPCLRALIDALGLGGGGAEAEAAGSAARAEGPPSGALVARASAEYARCLRAVLAVLSRARAADADAREAADDAASAAADAARVAAAAGVVAPAASAESAREAARCADAAAEAAARSEDDAAGPLLPRLTAALAECAALLAYAAPSAGLRRAEGGDLRGALAAYAAVLGDDEQRPAPADAAATTGAAGLGALRVCARGYVSERLSVHRLALCGLHTALGGAAAPSLGPRLLRAALRAAPACAQLLGAALAECVRPSAGVPAAARVQARHALTELACGRPRCALGWTYALAAANGSARAPAPRAADANLAGARALLRAAGADGWAVGGTDGGALPRLRSLFEEALDPAAAGGSAALWRLYLAMEAAAEPPRGGPASGAPPAAAYAADAASARASHRVGLRALQQCPWAQPLWLDVLAATPDGGGARGAELAQLAVARGIRARVQPPKPMIAPRGARDGEALAAAGAAEVDAAEGEGEGGNDEEEGEGGPPQPEPPLWAAASLDELLARARTRAATLAPGDAARPNGLPRPPPPPPPPPPLPPHSQWGAPGVPGGEAARGARPSAEACSGGDDEESPPQSDRGQPSDVDDAYYDDDDEDERADDEAAAVWW